MKKEYTVRMAWGCGFDDKVLVISNYTGTNEVVCYSFQDYTENIRDKTEVGMWKLKQLKNQL